MSTAEGVLSDRVKECQWSAKNRMERLKRAIESEVGREIERLIERRSSASTAEELLERLAPSETWRRFRRKYILNAVVNGDDALYEKLPRRFSMDVVVSSDDHSLTSIGSISSVSTTDTVVVFSDAEFVQVCELLASDDNFNKLQGLDMLARASSVENFIRTEEWSVLEKLLRMSLFAENSVIRSEVSNIYRMMICSTDDRTSLTAYSSMLKAVCNFLGRGETSQPKRLRQAVYLLDCLNDYHKECVAHRWLRTPTHIITAFIQSTLDCVAEKRLWTFLAGIDPTASWMQGWLAAAPIRSIVINEIRSRSLFIQIAVSRLADDQCHKTVLLYSCCVLLHFLRYEQGRLVIDSSVTIAQDDSWFTVLINCIKILLQFQPDPSLKDLCLQTVNAVSFSLSVDHQQELLHLSLSLFPKKISSETHLEQFDWASSLLLTLVKAPISRHVIVHSVIKDLPTSENLFHIFKSTFTMKHVTVPLNNPVFYLGVRKTIQSCTQILAHPIFLLRFPLTRVSALTLEALSLDTVLPRSFVVRMSLSSLGNALWKRGALNESAPRIMSDLCKFEGRVSETLLITNFLQYVPQVHLPGALEKFGMHIWKRHASDDARLEALLSVYSSATNVRTIFNTIGSASIIDRDLFRDVLLLPAHKRLGEDQVIMALTVLSVICSSLPSYIFLQDRFRLTEILRNELLKHVGDQDQYIVDEISNQVDSLISRITLVGGPSERKILGFNSSSQLKPVKRATSVSRSCRMNRDLSIDKRYFDEFIQDQRGLSRFQFGDIFSLAPSHELDELEVEMNDVDALGLQLILAYNSQAQIIEDLDTVITKSWYRLQANVGPTFRSTNLQTIDFTLASLFLLCRGDPGRALTLHGLLVDRGCSFVYFPDIFGISDSLVAASITQTLELILFNELPKVHFAFRRANFLARNLASFWIGQTLWNVVDLDEIATILAVCLVHGSDYLVYFCVAMLRHLQDDIVRLSLEGNLALNIRLEPVLDFEASESLEFCHRLRKVYKAGMLEAIENCKP